MPKAKPSRRNAKRKVGPVVRRKLAKPARVVPQEPVEPPAHYTEPDPRQLVIPGAVIPGAEPPARPRSRRSRCTITLYTTEQVREAVEQVQRAVTTVFYRPSVSELVLQAAELGFPLVVAKLSHKAEPKAAES